MAQNSRINVKNQPTLKSFTEKKVTLPALPHSLALRQKVSSGLVRRKRKELAMEENLDLQEHKKEKSPAKVGKLVSLKSEKKAVAAPKEKLQVVLRKKNPLAHSSAPASQSKPAASLASSSKKTAKAAPFKPLVRSKKIEKAVEAPQRKAEAPKNEKLKKAAVSSLKQTSAAKKNVVTKSVTPKNALKKSVAAPKQESKKAVSGKLPVPKKTAVIIKNSKKAPTPAVSSKRGKKTI